MKRIGTKTLVLFLCLTLVFSAALSASARASDYFSHTSVSATKSGSGTLRIKLNVVATGAMRELGASEIIVYEKQSNGTYQDVFTFKWDKYPTLVTKNRSSYVTYVTYPGTPGKTYYVTAHCYAANASGSQYTWAGSSAVTV